MIMLGGKLVTGVTFGSSSHGAAGSPRGPWPLTSPPFLGNVNVHGDGYDYDDGNADEHDDLENRCAMLAALTNLSVRFTLYTR